MATPTISAVSPTTGPAAGGQLVTIIGTGFKTPTLSYAVPTPSGITPTVSVTVNGRAARRVDVISATEVQILTPRLRRADARTDAFSPVNVVLANLDANGAPIVGESVTATAAFTYARWVLGAPRQDPPATRITKELVWALSLEVERNTFRGTHVDFGEEGAATVIDKAELPSVGLTMSVLNDPEFGAWDFGLEEIEQLDGSWECYEGGKTVQLMFDLLIAGATAGEAEHLAQAVVDFVQVNPLLRCAADPTLFVAGTEDDYPLEIWQMPQQVGGAADSGMVVYSLQLRIRGIRTLPDDPTLNAKPITTFTITTVHMADDGTSDGTPEHTDV